MKAGTAQKVALSLLSTAVMLRLGRVYKGLMIDMQASNQKLRSRAISTVAEISGVGAPAAKEALEHVGGDIKIAALVAREMDVAGGKKLPGGFRRQSSGGRQLRRHPPGGG